MQITPVSVLFFSGLEIRKGGRLVFQDEEEISTNSNMGILVEKNAIFLLSAKNTSSYQ